MWTHSGFVLCVHETWLLLLNIQHHSLKIQLFFSSLMEAGLNSPVGNICNRTGSFFQIRVFFWSSFWGAVKHSSCYRGSSAVWSCDVERVSNWARFSPISFFTLGVIMVCKHCSLTRPVWPPDTNHTWLHMFGLKRTWGGRRRTTFSSMKCKFSQ